MKDLEQFRKQERFLARDIIELAREKQRDYSVLESLSSFCFEIMMMKDSVGVEGGVDWQVIFDELDDSYAKKKYMHDKIDEEYDRIVDGLAAL